MNIKYNKYFEGMVVSTIENFVSINIQSSPDDLGELERIKADAEQLHSATVKLFVHLCEKGIITAEELERMVRGYNDPKGCEFVN